MSFSFSAPSSQKPIARPISFVLDDQTAGGPSEVLDFWVRPEDLTRSDPSRLTVQQTLGGAWADSFGPGVPQISISGTTGWRTDVSGSDGIARWLALKEMCFDGWHARRAAAIAAGLDPNGVNLIFADALDEFAAIVAPVNCTLRRSRSRPLLIQYQMTLIVVGDASDPGATDAPLSAADLQTLGIAGITGALNDLTAQIHMLQGRVYSAIASVMAPVQAFMNATIGVFQAAVGLVSTVGSVAASVVDTVTMTAQAGLNLFATVASVAELPAVVAGQFMAIASSYAAVARVVASALNGPLIVPDYTGLYGASGGGNLVGGSPPSGFNNIGASTLANVVPALPAPAIIVSQTAQVQLAMLAGSDPVLAPLSLNQIALAAGAIASGITISSGALAPPTPTNATFEKELTGYRFIDTNHGDTLIAIAGRELNDGTRWAEIAWMNGLVYPWITDDPTLVRPGVVLSGTQLMVPAASPTVSVATDPTAVFLTDAALVNGRIAATGGGDIQTVSGLANLNQALLRRIEVDRGELVMHPLYGSGMRKMIGKGNSPALALILGQYAKSAIARDPRIAAVPRATVVSSGDGNVVTVGAETILGRPVQATGTL